MVANEIFQQSRTDGSSTMPLESERLQTKSIIKIGILAEESHERAYRSRRAYKFR
jgi:hypothetical protein